MRVEHTPISYHSEPATWYDRWAEGHAHTLLTRNGVFLVGFFSRIRSFFRRGNDTPPAAAPIDAPISEPDDSPDWGRAFGAGDEGWTVSNDGYDFGWYLAGYKAIGGEREDLEQDPGRVLTDRELAHADYVVVHFTGGIYKTFTSGPWQDWEELWIEIADFYDIYGE